jgi:hypothetical protein
MGDAPSTTSDVTCNAPEEAGSVVNVQVKVRREATAPALREPGVGLQTPLLKATAAGREENPYPDTVIDATLASTVGGEDEDTKGITFAMVTDTDVFEAADTVKSREPTAWMFTLLQVNCCFPLITKIALGVQPPKLGFAVIDGPNPAPDTV